MSIVVETDDGYMVKPDGWKSREEFEALLSDHDWYYTYTDDIRLYHKGENEREVLIIAQNANPELIPLYEEIYNEKFKALDPRDHFSDIEELIY